MKPTRRARCLAPLIGGFALLLASVAGAASEDAPSSPAGIDTDVLRSWVEEMKFSPRGPFSRIRWFCNDGTVLDPVPYACQPHGGGHQHGEYTERTVAIREAGYLIANLLAGFDPESLPPDELADLVRQLTLERFLLVADDGWILRRARFYRGAIQEEDETWGARVLLEHLAAEDRWVARDFLALRSLAAVLPHGAATPLIARIRQDAVALEERDPGFLPLRTKIHGLPDGGDARRVREYARGVSDPELSADFEALAQAIDEAYAGSPLARILQTTLVAAGDSPELAMHLSLAAEELGAGDDAWRRLSVSADALAAIRRHLPHVRDPASRMALLDASLAAEQVHFVAGTAVHSRLVEATRFDRLRMLEAAGRAAFGVGVLSERELKALQDSVHDLAVSTTRADIYKQTVDYLARAPGWATQWMRFQYDETVLRFEAIEPKSAFLIPDRLRGGPMLFYSRVLDSLVRDANRLAGVRQTLFGDAAGAGLRALNPGIARGVLRRGDTRGGSADFRPDGIYLLPETTATLPPVAGILTVGEGNPLSHIQLLARNLGIPNVSVDLSLLPSLSTHAGRRVLLAVSPAGSVRLDEDTGELDALFDDPGGSADDVLIRPDIRKLRLNFTRPIPLKALRATDSGRIVGPKAAKLGELKYHYPAAVADGVTIPFGVFDRILSEPMVEGGPTIRDWMVAGYRQLEAMPAGSPAREQSAEALRQALYSRLERATLPADFRDELRATMADAFGADGTYGVFIRSDTNVEDLPGFTGAGLNLTVPNVVGFDDIVRNIPRVWASPFTARAFAWRQSRMDRPEHVYPAVLLMRSVPADKSGVLVTQDIDTGDDDWISVAINEGVGGAVDGQSAESLRINVATGEVRLLASATAPWRRDVPLDGGVRKVPVRGGDAVLTPAEIQQLVDLARGLPSRFPPIVDASGQAAPADIEFGFEGGELRLFQIRPFLGSETARRSSVLREMDGAVAAAGSTIVRLRDIP